MIDDLNIVLGCPDRTFVLASSMDLAQIMPSGLASCLAEIVPLSLIVTPTPSCWYRNSYPRPGRVLGSRGSVVQMSPACFPCPATGKGGRYVPRAYRSGFVHNLPCLLSALTSEAARDWYSKALGAQVGRAYSTFRDPSSCYLYLHNGFANQSRESHAGRRRRVPRCSNRQSGIRAESTRGTMGGDQQCPE